MEQIKKKRNKSDKNYKKNDEPIESKKAKNKPIIKIIHGPITVDFDID